MKTCQFAVFVFGFWFRVLFSLDISRPGLCLVQFGHIPSRFGFLVCFSFGLGLCLGGCLPTPLLVELRSFVWRGLGEPGQLGLPSCLFGHSASFGGWVGCCRCLARLPFLLLCSLLVPLPCWVWGAWPLLRCVCFAACPRPLLLWLRVVLAGCPALFRHRLVWSSLVFWLCCGFPLLGVDLLFSQDLSV